MFLMPVLLSSGTVRTTVRVADEHFAVALAAAYGTLAMPKANMHKCDLLLPCNVQLALLLRHL